MRITTLLIVIVLSTTVIYSQTKVRDSIAEALRKSKPDSTKVILLNKLSALYQYVDPDTALSLGLDALSLSQQIDFTTGIAGSLTRIGNAQLWMGNYPKALKAYFQSQKIAESTYYLKGQQENLSNIGIVYKEQGDYRQALDYYFKSKLLSEGTGDKFNTSNVLINIGQSYMYLKAFDTARLFAEQAIGIANNINAFELIEQAYNLLGDISFANRLYPLALDYYRLSLVQSQKDDDFLGQCYNYLGMAKAFEKTKQLDSAIIYAKQALTVAREKKFLKRIPEAGLIIYSVYKSKGILDSALYYHEIAKVANDSLYSDDLLSQIRELSFDEKLREIETKEAQEKENEQREHNLQYAGIAITIIAFVILFFVFSRSIIVKEKFISFFGELGLLAVFEFINLLIHPYLETVTHHSPVMMLLILIGIGALLVPLHHKLQHWLTHKMIEKNKNIRLAAAKKTIAQLEGDKANVVTETSRNPPGGEK
jgi:tetratricopeptide (TPR) repeat protein